jgi:tetratricopeptide (TPR) repeat protein
LAQSSLKFKEAKSLHQRGRLAQARSLYEEILRIEPRNFDALLMLGMIAGQAGNFARSVELTNQALEINPNDAAAHNNRGLALKGLKQFDAALLSYEHAVALQADFAEAHSNRGNLLRELHDLAAALASYDYAIAVRPDHAHSHYNRGVVLAELERWDEALASYDRAIAIKPDAESYYNRGIVLTELERWDEALVSYDRAIAIKPEYAQAHSNRGMVLQQLEDFVAALASYDRAIALKADLAEAHSNRGNVLRQFNRLDEALASCKQAVALEPDFAEGHSNLGNVLVDLRQFDAAAAHYDRAIALNPDFAAAHSNLGNVFLDLRQFDVAVAHYDRAIALNPNFAAAHFGRSFARLAQGDFAGGWLDYEWRSRIGSITTRRDLSRPLWLGQHSIAQKTILLHSEQGLGDTLQFCRYVPLVAELGARVVLEVQTPLAGLLASLKGVAQLVTTGMNLPQFDYHCPLMSLPLAFKTRLGTIPAAIPYLSCDASKVADWRSKLGSAKRIGLAWSGSQKNKNDRHRSIALAALSEHLPADLQYVSLQKDLRETDERTLASHPQILPAGANFSDTAALCECLDMVICVDTSIAHLAGGLGKETWILLPFNSDWRWLVDRHDSPWYPTAKLYRQRQMGDWRDVLDQVRVDLIERYKSVIENSK